MKSLSPFDTGGEQASGCVGKGLFGPSQGWFDVMASAGQTNGVRLLYLLLWKNLQREFEWNDLIKHMCSIYVNLSSTLQKSLEINHTNMQKMKVHCIAQDQLKQFRSLQAGPRWSSWQSLVHENYNFCYSYPINTLPGGNHKVFIHSPHHHHLSSTHGCFNWDIDASWISAVDISFSTWWLFATYVGKM